MQHGSSFQGRVTGDKTTYAASISGCAGVFAEKLCFSGEFAKLSAAMPPFRSISEGEMLELPGGAQRFYLLAQRMPQSCERLALLFTAAGSPGNDLTQSGIANVENAPLSSYFPSPL